MDKLLKDKIALISGCDSGIGRNTCLLFAREGAIVYANTLFETSNEGLIEAGKGLQGSIIPVSFDITDKKAIGNCIKKIKNEQNGKLDVLVNNAGWKKDAFLEMIDDESINKMIDINIIGMIHLTQAALRLMKRNTQGAAIVNISSIVGLKGNIGQSVYGATKGAVASLTKSWAKEYVSSNIRVNAVAPGSIDTDMFYEMKQEDISKSIERIGMKRLGKPEEVANVILFLASHLSSYITGELIGVDGGLYM